MQWGHRVALIGIVEKQYVHSFVVGTAGAATSFLLSLLIFRVKRNMTKARMRKLMMRKLAIAGFLYM